jgi:single-strand DNA-binding protein
MLNQVVLVGRLTADLEVEERKGKKVTSLLLAVQRSTKNSDGIYEADFIRCTLWDAIAARTTEYCKKGDIIGIKGRIQTSTYKDKSGKTQYSTEVIAEKVTFLSSKKEGED